MPALAGVIDIRVEKSSKTIVAEDPSHRKGESALIETL
jgi:hypothetical protein